MRHRVALLLVLVVLVIAACGSAEPGSSASGEPTTTAAADPTAVPGEPASSPTTTSFPPAPDFTLELADGSTFDLSDEQKPVFLVFWAEW